jgi:hypothetical protein
MKSDDAMASDNVIPFPKADGHRSTAASDDAVERESDYDHGPTPDESLRLMRAFVGIKNKTLRADLITMLEGAARSRAPEPERRKE